MIDFLILIVFPILIAAFSTYIAIVILRPIAKKINLTDVPSDRKLHKGSVPLIGGIAMFFGIVISILVFSPDLNEYKYFLLASIIIVSIGVLDDHLGLSVTIRLIFQGLVAIVIVSGGNLSITSIGNLFGFGEIFLNGWSYFATVIAIIAVINAMNMSDGAHGLAAGNSLFTFAAVLLLSSVNLPFNELWILLIFCAVLPVFLVHNLCLGMSKSKRIFMGDGGSMLLGVTIVWFLLDLSQGEIQVFNPITAVWLLAVPLIDMVSIIFNRIVAGKSPFKPDLFHMHHLLMHLGFKERNILLIILSFSFLMTVVGILGELYEVDEWAMFYGFLMVFAIYITWNRFTIKRIKNKNELSD